MSLKSLSEIFEHRLIRIPDYQRGYAWEKEQLEAFWEDLIQLNEARIHYTGVITLEPVKPEITRRWDEDRWLVEGMGYKPFYVVDGQQRLTTAVILVQAILDAVKPDQELNYQLPEMIRSKFIVQKGADGLRSACLFGYEKDNPSYEFLKTRIFGQYSHSNQDQQTLYTKNLLVAKNYFDKQLSRLTTPEIAVIYQKLTQKFKFNLYNIDAGVDVFVTFETMNNRGKGLSKLELLKNRLIYLSTLFQEDEGHEALREMINGAWKTIYEYLGRNPGNPLSDDLFLRNHWGMYFKYTKKNGSDYEEFLLGSHFTAKNVTHPSSEDKRIQIEDVESYVKSLQAAAKPWFYMHNPHARVPGYDNDENRHFLHQLNRLKFRGFKPLILAAYCREYSMNAINSMLTAMERFNFMVFHVSQRNAGTADSKFRRMATDLYKNQNNLQQTVQEINQELDVYYSASRFRDKIVQKFELKNDGYYAWDGLKYFLYEFEESLRHKGKQYREQLSWDAMNRAKSDHVTIEHIYPQTETNDWTDCFAGYDEEQKYRLTHSLGNLLPLSRAKNSSLQNDSFQRKKNNGDGVGYYNGSAAESEVALLDQWGPQQILNRGLGLLAFMEERWTISLGDEEYKKTLLGLSFMKDRDSVFAVGRGEEIISTPGVENVSGLNF